MLTVKLSLSYHRVLFLGQSLRMTNNLPFLRPFCMQWKTNKYNSYLASYLSLHGKWINTGVWNMKVCLLADINRLWYCCMLLFRATLNCSLGKINCYIIYLILKPFLKDFQIHKTSLKYCSWLLKCYILEDSCLFSCNSPIYNVFIWDLLV